MTLLDFRRTFNALSDEKKEKFAVDLYRRQTRQGKELEEILLRCIREDRDLPPLKAAVPALNAAKKTVSRMEEQVFSWKVRRSRSVSRFKKSVRELYKELTLCPVQAEGYEETVTLLMRLYSLMARSQNGYLPVGDIFEATGIRRMDFFRTLCSMQLARGYTRQALEQLIVFDAEVEPADPRIVLEQSEILLTFLRNGDLRLEVLELCEARMQTVLQQRGRDRTAERIIRNLRLLSMLIREQELGDDAAWKALRAQLPEDDYRDFREFWILAHGL